MNSASRQIREQVLRVSHASGHGHIPTCFSIVELLLASYKCMKHNPADPTWDARDIFILSKGHGALGLYCTLSHLGYFPMDQVFSFGGFGSSFGCHADRFKVPGIEASTGSLGHGIGLAVGMAMAFKIQGSGRKVFCVIGDGEANEGTVWEALMAATHLELDGLTVLFDHNRSQGRALPIFNPVEKFESFGCDVKRVDGHDIDALCSAIQSERTNVRVVVADTVKGKGCPTLSDEVYAWHRRAPSEEELASLVEELDAAAI